MKVKVVVFNFASGKPEEMPCNKFELIIDAPYNQYAENDEFLKDLCAYSAQYLGTDGLASAPFWKSQQEKSCEIIVNYTDEGGVQTDPVTIRNNTITSARERMKKRECRFLMNVTWE